MAYYQIEAFLEGDVTVLFGLSADGEAGALAAAGERLSEFPRPVLAVRAAELPADRWRAR
jgi:hypothetical protein